MADDPVESRVEFKKRLRAEGRYVEFQKHFQVLRKSKMTQEKIYQVMREKYQPIGGNVRYVPAPAVDVVDALVVHESSGRTAKKAKIFAGKKCDNREVIQWVFDNLGVSDVKAKDAPSSGAWQLLQDCKADDKVRQDFFKNIWTELLPSKTQIDSHNRFKDDGATIIELLEKLRKAKAGPEAPAPKVLPIENEASSHDDRLGVKSTPDNGSGSPVSNPGEVVVDCASVPVVDSDLGADDEF